MTRDEILSLFARRRDAWRRHDAAALAADHTEDGTFDSPMAGTVAGRDAIRSVYQAWFTGFPDFTLDDQELIVDADRVASFLIEFRLPTVIRPAQPHDVGVSVRPQTQNERHAGLSEAGG